mmetsp:Transcript_2693/g.6755  ORF Transcript_2693/g.6755 Transcript_2693/m.6755 type:complete len:494 (-) Transcript_2693:181-1662(-)
MNSRIAEPFQCTELPELIEDYLEHKCARCCAFNRKGTLLAAGCSDGAIVVWDFETRGVALTLEGHQMGVVSLSWSRNGRVLVSGGADQCLIQWDVASRREVARLSVENTITCVSMDPAGAARAVVSCTAGPPLLADFATGAMTPLPLLYFENQLLKWRPEDQAELQNCSGIFDATGSLIYVAAPKACLVVVDAITLKPVDLVKVGGTSRVLGLSLCRKGRFLVVNSNDKTVRVFSARRREPGGEDDCLKVVRNVAASQTTPAQGSLLGKAGVLALEHEFQVAEQRSQWKATGLSNDSQHLAAAALSKSDHHIYIFDRESGRPERVLEGPHEGVADLIWHPVWPLLLSVSAANGRIYIWSKVYSENWHAFAPDFRELTQNEEYVEREDEFDLVPDEAKAPAAQEAPSGDEELDILGADERKALDSEEEDALVFIPVTAKDVIPEGGVGGQPAGAEVKAEAVAAGDAAAGGEAAAGAEAEDAQAAPAKRAKVDES